jgi:hypothetical protein
VVQAVRAPAYQAGGLYLNPQCCQKKKKKKKSTKTYSLNAVMAIFLIQHYDKKWILGI